MPREPRLERLPISAECRTTKDWFPTRESADAVIREIGDHIKATGESHTWRGHTHTRPSDDAVPVYIGEFELPERYLKAKRFAPCPCCWDEFGKFGHGMIAWFPLEHVIRLIGPDCFKNLNPEAHAKARKDYDIEQERKRNTDFLLANLPRLPDVIGKVDRAIVVAKAVETFHTELHDKLTLSRLNLWPYVRQEGKLTVQVAEQEFRRGASGEMYARDIDGSRVAFILQGYRMLDPELGSLSKSLENSRGKIAPYMFGEDWKSSVDAMDDEKKRAAADTLSRNVKKAKEKIAEIEELQPFTERVAINTLRSWGAHEGCPIPYNYSHDGDRISFGKSDYQNLSVALPSAIRNPIGKIEFWSDLGRRRR